MKKQTTHIAVERISADRKAGHICRSLNIDMSEYYNIFYETGCNYLENWKELMINQGVSLQKAEHDMRLFQHAKWFWIWWRLQYRIVDNTFLFQGLKNAKLYFQMHVAITSYPGDKIVRNILNESKKIQDKQGRSTKANKATGATKEVTG